MTRPKLLQSTRAAPPFVPARAKKRERDAVGVRFFPCFIMFYNCVSAFCLAHILRLCISCDRRDHMHMKIVSTQAPHFMAFMTFFTFIPFTFMPFMTFFTFIPFMVVFFTFFPFGVFLFLEQLYDLLVVLDLLLGMERRYEALPCRSASLCLFASQKSRNLCHAYSHAFH